jgi:hypothetical protein
MSQNTVANTIYEQLGGSRFRIMTGAKDFMADKLALSFKLPSKPHWAKNNINYIHIQLDDLADLYTVTFSRLRGVNLTQIAKYEEVYADRLAILFKEETGLDTRL